MVRIGGEGTVNEANKHVNSTNMGEVYEFCENREEMNIFSEKVLKVRN